MGTIREPFYWTFGGVNEASVMMCRKLLQYGIRREMNGFQKNTASACYEMPGPVVIEITDPTARQILIPERKWNKILPMAESLWMLRGANHLDDLPGHFVKSIYNFSDDGQTWRGGYGPRLRGFTGLSNQYDRHMEGVENDSYDLWTDRGNIVKVDQLEYVIETLTKEPTSRQALITIHDPAKDSLLKLKTKDIPCTRSLHFMIVEGKLNMYAHLRSNDTLWGAQAVNWYNFTLMQQYVAKILGVPLGSYFHIADNFHYYENSKEMIETLAGVDVDKAIEYDCSLHNEYNDKIRGLDELDFVALNMYRTEVEFWKLSNDVQFWGPSEEKKIKYFLKNVRSLLKNIKDNYPDPFFRGWLYAFPLAMKPIRKTVKEWLIKNGESDNKMIAQFF